MFNHFWDVDRLVKGEAEIVGYRPLFRELVCLGFYITGMGCRPMGLPMFRTHLQCINRYLGDVRKYKRSSREYLWLSAELEALCLLCVKNCIAK
jgi:hypothetical protein